MRRPALLAAALLASAAPAAAQVDGGMGLRAFRNWLVACDETGACAAYGFPPEASRHMTAVLRLRLDAGAAAKPVLDAYVGEAEIAAPRLDLPAAPTPLEQLLAAARAKNAAVIRVSAPEGGAAGEVSLDGLSQALAHLDDRQGRKGAQTALVAGGDKPASAVPGPRPARAIVAAPFATAQETPAPASLVAALRRTDRDCDGQHGKARVGRQWPLDGKRALVELECALGAYNLMTGYWIVENGKARGAKRLRFDMPGEKATDRLVNATLAPASGVVETEANGRGLGDCGSRARYVWTGAGFALARFSAMSECAGLPPGWWPTLLRGAP